MRRIRAAGGVIAVEQPQRWPDTYDPDLDANPQQSAGPREAFESYQRFIANPFLAVLGCLLALLVIRSGLRAHHLAWFLGGLCLFGLAFLLIQFHCLDCGATGWLVTWRRHACPGLMDRWRAGRPGRWRPPPLSTQIAGWVYIIASAGALAMVLLGRSR